MSQNENPQEDLEIELPVSDIHDEPVSAAHDENSGAIASPVDAEDDGDAEAPKVKQFDDTPACVFPVKNDSRLVDVSSPFYGTPEKAQTPTDLPINTATAIAFDVATDEIDSNTFDPDQEWVVELTNSLNSTKPFMDQLEPATNRNSVWAQRVEHDGRKYGPAIPKIAQPKSDNELLSGMAALMKVQALTSTGRRLTIPFWASGVWISFRAPTLEDIVELERRMVESKSVLGRTTHGFIFSNQGVYVESLFIDFALRHAFDSSVKAWTPDVLRSVLRHSDLQALAAAIAATIYPNGFSHAQPCMADPLNCQHVARDVINPMKLFWTDISRLSESQKKFMAVSQVTKQELSEVLKYQDQFPSSEYVVKSYQNGAMRIVYKVPTLTEYIDSGMQWITTLEQRAEETFGVNLRGKQRDDYLSQVAAAARSVMYAHWVKEIQLPDAETELCQVISDPDSIVDALKTLSANSDLADQFFKDVLEFINDSIITIIGIPNYACPSCKKWHGTEQGAVSKVIPVDAVSVFFRLQQLLIIRTTQ